MGRNNVFTEFQELWRERNEFCLKRVFKYLSSFTILRNCLLGIRRANAIWLTSRKHEREVENLSEGYCGQRPVHI